MDLQVIRNMVENGTLLMVNDVARILGVSPSTIRGYDRDGLLRAARTASGTRLFDREDVQRFAAERAQRQQPKDTPPSEP